MQYYHFLLAVFHVALAVCAPRSSSTIDYKPRLTSRGRFGSGEKSIPRVRPQPPASQQGRSNPDVGSVHQIARKEPQFPYPKAPFATQKIDGRPAVGGPTVFEKPDGAGWLGNLYIGGNDASWANGVKLSEQLYPELSGRQYTRLTTEPTPRDLRRKSSLQRHKEAQAVMGWEPRTPPNWHGDKGWYKGLTVRYEQQAAQRRQYILSEVSKRLEVWSISPEGQRTQLHDNTRPQRFLNSPRDQPLPSWAGRTGRRLPYPVTPEPGIGGLLGNTLYDRIIDPGDAAKARRLKRDGLDNISNQENEANSGATNTPDQLSTDFQTYLEAYVGAQNNASNLILPILDEMLNGTNSSIVYDAAWSIYADLTGTSPMVIGPFIYGMHSLDWIEDQMFANSTNSTTRAESQYQTEVLAMHAVLLDLYNYGWSKSIDVLNTTGLLDDMHTLSAYLSSNDTSIMPAGYPSWFSSSYDDSYITIYNQTM